ncbi:MAG TPA: hypothetical protein PLF08_06430 [Bacillota bacterium]|nr:hypothetical protein [Bacillota bacterium]HPZ78735.1 hypothetical protein [Bacillota bacterium]HQD74807.1 hypothetical protein [Bacillota bacterium]
MLNYKQPAFWIVATAVVACIVLAICLIANPQNNSTKETGDEEYDTYTAEGVSISVPKEYADLVVVDAKSNDEYLHQIVALYYRPAYDAHNGLGLMFSIKRCSYEQMLEILSEASDGIYLKATDGENYYLYCEPTDAQWNLPEEADEYEKIRDSIIISYGDLDVISDADMETLSTQADSAAASYRNIRFYMDNAEDAALAFVSEEYGALLINLPENNRFAVTSYEMLDHSLWETTNNAVSGKFSFAVKPIQEVYYVGLNTQRGTGEYEGWLILNRSYTLVRDDEGYWTCTQLKDIHSTTASEDGYPDRVVTEYLEAEKGKDYVISLTIEKVEISDDETAKIRAMYSGSELAKTNGWTDDYIANNMIAVYAKYTVDYDNTKVPYSEGELEQYFYLTRADLNTDWTIWDSTSPSDIR